MFSESVMWSVVTFGAITWIVTYGIEACTKVYNRCKRREQIRRRVRELGFDPKEHGL